MNAISPQDLKKELDSGTAVLIDVRESWEFEEGSITPRNISLYELPGRMEELSAMEAKRIVFCCNTGQNSEMALNLALESGLENVAHLEGGINAWKTIWPG